MWIVADVRGNEGEFRPGVHVKVTVPELGKVVDATVSSTVPLFDETSRTLKVRLEAANPGLRLRPDMFVDVEFETPMPAGLAVPAEAVLDSGTRKVVYVETSDGVFEQRPVEISGTFGDQVIVASGIGEGDRVVVSGNFLLDSESRMRASGNVAPDAKPAMQPVGESAIKTLQRRAARRPAGPGVRNDAQGGGGCVPGELPGQDLQLLLGLVPEEVSCGPGQVCRGKGECGGDGRRPGGSPA